ncbi:MAG: DUF2304 family protein [Microbacteriaceae bacterium]
MTLFQLFLILGVVVTIFLSSRFLPGDGSLALKRLAALLFAVLAVLAIIFPAGLSAIAQAVGIGRGTDLLLYVSVLAMLAFAVATVRGRAKTDIRVTQLAREVALLNARIDESAAGSTSEASKA